MHYHFSARRPKTTSQGPSQGQFETNPFETKPTLSHNRGKIGAAGWFFNKAAAGKAFIRGGPMGAKIDRPRALFSAALLVLFAALTLSAAPLSAKTASKKIEIVVLGDSLTAGYGLRSGDAFPVRLQAALKQRGHDLKVINAGVSGDTTAAGLARLDWAVPKGVDAVIVELGANDALRGLPPAKARANLDKLLQRLRQRGAMILLAGMVAPKNLGKDYTTAFDGMFKPLAQKYDAIYYPFFLQGVALQPRLNLSDGMHPNRRGVDIIVTNIMPKVEELIGRVKAKRQARSGG